MSRLKNFFYNLLRQMLGSKISYRIPVSDKFFKIHCYLSTNSHFTIAFVTFFNSNPLLCCFSP